MVWVATAVIGSAVIGGVVQSKAAGKAADASVESSAAGIAEQRRQFDEIQKILAPYSKGGAKAFSSQQDLVGLGGDEAQQEAINQIEQSPAFTSLVNQGEEAILQNASSTGGLRGGNTQGALAQFRPQILSQLIESQFSKLGGISGLGQASAAGEAAAAQNTGNNVTSLIQDQGSARAGEAIAKGQGFANAAGSVGNVALLKGLGALKF